MDYPKHIIKTLGTLILVLGASVPQALSLERFVAVCANNGNGASASCASSPGGTGAFNSIQAGVDALVAGDTLTVLDGTYSTGGTTTARVGITTAGTSSSPIAIRSRNKHGAKIDATGKSYVVHIHGSANHITFDGFDLYNAVNEGVFIRTNPAQGGGGGGFIEILNNKIHNNGNGGNCASPFGQDGIFEDAHDVLIKGNIIYDNGRKSCTDINLDHGIYITGYNVTIQENILYSNATWGITLTFMSSHPSPNGANLLVKNNVIYDQDWGGGIILWCSSGPCSTQKGTIENNIIHKNDASGDGIAVYFYNLSIPSLQYTVRNNIFYANFNDSVVNTGGEGTITQANNIKSDPLFVDEAIKDFHLQPPSPARGAGFGGVDIGAYPQGSTTSSQTRPLAPSGLRVLE